MHMRGKCGFSFISVLMALVVGAFLGAAGTWFVLEKEKERAAPPSSGAAPQPERPHGGAPTDEDYLSRKLREWNLDPEQLREELEKAGRVLRQTGREFGSRFAEKTSDVRIIAIIKAKYTLDEELSAWQISVGCKDGHVTLSGTVDSSEQIGRAIVFALDTKGVVDVDSMMRVKAR